MSDVLTVINERKSVRNYSDQPVKPEDLKVIAESAIWAPNGMNKQAWHFSVVSNPELLDRMRKACRKGMADSNLPFLQERLQNPDYDAFFHAPAVIVISIAEDRLTFFDSGAAAATICLAAKGLGYGSCITASTAFMFEGDPEIKSALEIPDDYHFACAVSIGIEKDGPDDHVRDRNKEVISYL